MANASSGGRHTTPTLTRIADFLVEVGAPIAVGETGQGLRRGVPIADGVIQGGRLNGTIPNARADYQVIGPDGFTRLEARYVARLDDGSVVYIENRRAGGDGADHPRRPVDPAEVNFRSAPRFDNAPAHQWLTRPLFIASGARYPDRVSLSVFEVD